MINNELNLVREKIFNKPSEIELCFQETLHQMRDLKDDLKKTIPNIGSIIKKHKLKNKKQTILYIDDEGDNLMSFKAIFRRDFKILTALNFDDMEKIIENEKIDIIVSDLKIQGKDGIYILEYAKRKYPKIKRFLTSGFVNQETSSKLIANNVIIDCFHKPWKIQDMSLAFVG